MRRINVRTQRIKAGMSQSQLSGKLGVGISTLRAWENDRAQPMAGYLPDLAEILGCEIEDLFEPRGQERGGSPAHTEGQTSISM